MPDHSTTKKESHQRSKSATQEAREEANDLKDQAKEQARSQAAVQKGKATDSLKDVAHALRETGDNLHARDQDAFGQYANQAADQVERFARHLRSRSPEQLLHEAQDYARREPALFLGGAFALGVLGARFLKSSSPGRPVDRRYDRDTSSHTRPRSGESEGTMSVPTRHDTGQADEGASDDAPSVGEIR